jgi:hypothetical protein
VSRLAAADVPGQPLADMSAETITSLLDQLEKFDSGGE